MSCILFFKVSVSGSDDSIVWGTRSKSQIFRWKGGDGDKEWEHIGGQLDMVSCGYMGVWGVNRGDDIWHMKGTYGDINGYVTTTFLK